MAKQGVSDKMRDMTTQRISDAQEMIRRGLRSDAKVALLDVARDVWNYAKTVPGEDARGRVMQYSLEIKGLADEIEADTRNSIKGRIEAAFDGFVGNDSAREMIYPHLYSAMRSTGKRLEDNFAFIGPPGVGKTEFARRVARALDVPFVSMSATEINKSDDIAQKIAANSLFWDGDSETLFTPNQMTLFIDEIHALKSSIQKSLLTALEHGDRTLHTGIAVVNFRPVSVICATTDFGTLLKPLKSRLNPIRFHEYTEEEIEKILRTKFPNWTSDVYRRIAVAGRLNPRKAHRMARDFEKVIASGEMATLETLERRLGSSYGIDEVGLNAKDRELMDVMANDSDGKMGKNALANRLRVNVQELMEDIEPYLLRLGFIEMTQGGRAITEKGREYVSTLT